MEEQVWRIPGHIIEPKLVEDIDMDNYRFLESCLADPHDLLPHRADGMSNERGNEPLHNAAQIRSVQDAFNFPAM